MITIPSSSKISLRDATIIIRQQPVAARMSGMLDMKTKRLLDPPLIIQIEFDAIIPDDVLSKHADLMVCKLCLLDSNDNPADFATKKVPWDPAGKHLLDPNGFHNMIGSHVSVSVPLVGEEFLQDQEAEGTGQAIRNLFFVFPDLCIRIPGDYYFKCFVFCILE